VTHREGLKPIAELLKVDERNLAFVRFNSEINDYQPLTLEDHHADIEQYHLENYVPEDIATQYDIARNLYLYSWFEYRFYNVAESKALTVLELALKRRIGEQPLKAYIKQRQQEHKKSTGKKLSLNRGLKVLMEYCRDHKLVNNQGFSAWQQSGKQKAYIKAEEEQRQWATDEMERTGKDEIILPDIYIEDIPPDPDYNHVQHLVDNTNTLRNTYAHGTTMLYKNVLYTFEMASEFVNQVYRANRSNSDFQAKNESKGLTNQ